MTAKKQLKGSVLGGTLLIAGCCIGAGMLGLPVLSAPAGFIPTLVMFFASWLFMTITGLLFLEVNLWFKDDVSIISMAGRTLGNIGRAIGWVVFLFLFYSLMVAYVSGSGQLFADYFHGMTNISIPVWAGSLVFIAIFGLFVYLGTGAVDRFNRLLMLGLVLSYILLVVTGLPYVNLELLKHTDWSATTLVIPAMIVSFGFHNLVPTLTTYLHGDARRLRLTIVLGSAIPLMIYLLWEFLILGLVPLHGVGGFQEALANEEMTTQALKTAVGSSWIVDLAHYFAFFAIVTSFLGVSLSFVDFLADGLKINKDRYGKLLLCCLVLGPPFIFAIVYPKVFLIALKYAGGFGAVILFGILPAAMVWSGRYIKKLETKPLVPGGKALLILVILFACAVMALQVAEDIFS